LARQVIEGVAVTAAAPSSFDCDVIVKFVGGMTYGIVLGENESTLSHGGGEKSLFLH
jgi:hypothetical protein